MKTGKVIKAFPFAFDGINVSHLAVAATFPPEGFAVSDSAFDGLIAAGYLEEDKRKAVPEEEKLNRDILKAYDRKLAAASDEELKGIIARSGQPYSGNLVHAALVLAAKQQMLRELQGTEPILSIDPNSGVTEQPLSAPGAPTPPSAAAAVDQQRLQLKAADDAARRGENKATDQFSQPLPAGGEKSGAEKLDEMTVAELKELAEKRGVDLGDATKKADIVDLITKSGK